MQVCDEPSHSPIPFSGVDVVDGSDDCSVVDGATDSVVAPGTVINQFGGLRKHIRDGMSPKCDQLRQEAETTEANWIC